MIFDYNSLFKSAKKREWSEGTDDNTEDIILKKRKNKTTPEAT